MFFFAAVCFSPEIASWWDSGKAGWLAGWLARWRAYGACTGRVGCGAVAAAVSLDGSIVVTGVTDARVSRGQHLYTLAAGWRANEWALELLL
jgi:hypothetical protein